MSDNQTSDNGADSDHHGSEVESDSTISFFIKGANIKNSPDKRYVLSLPVTTSIVTLKGILEKPEYAEIPVDRQRLIYSGRVLKDEDTLESIKLSPGNSIYLVKGADSNAQQQAANAGANARSLHGVAAAAGSADNRSALPTNMATGIGSDPFAALTGARYAGFHGLPSANMFGPDGGMGPPDANGLQRALEDPNIATRLNEIFDNPQFLQTMENSPMFRANPMLRELLRNPDTRRMITDPNMIRSMIELSRTMRGPGMGGSQPFPAPGSTDTTEPGAAASGNESDSTAGRANATQQANAAAAFANMMGLDMTGTGIGAQQPFLNGAFNPLAMFGMPPRTNTVSATTPANTGGGSGGADPSLAPIIQIMNRMMQNPQLVQQMMPHIFGGIPGFPAGPTTTTTTTTNTNTATSNATPSSESAPASTTATAQSTDTRARPEGGTVVSGREEGTALTSQQQQQPPPLIPTMDSAQQQALFNMMNQFGFPLGGGAAPAPAPAPYRGFFPYGIPPSQTPSANTPNTGSLPSSLSTSSPSLPSSTAAAGVRFSPIDNRPPEDRYAEQLRQLNDMGFFEFERNVEALRRSGGSVQGAVEYLLS